ncbi:MAG: hypothetical protein EOP74_01850 [Variovorax sp.]|nr:MAG: hypothetical protein EOP74_01850 [Variovorax sp.]
MKTEQYGAHPQRRLLNERVDAGVSNDTLNGLKGSDTMIGGTGDDTYWVDASTDVVVELENEGNDTVIATASLTLGANVENLRINTSGAMNASGNAADNLFYAGTGDNVIDGAGGIDTVSYQWANAAVSVNLSNTSAQAAGGSGRDTLLNIENLTGSAFDDTLEGNFGANRLQGGLGNDTLVGGAGDDTYVLGRGEGSDVIVENDAGAGNTDVALFGGGVAADQLWFTRTGNNLDIAVIGTDDKFTVADWYSGSAYHVEKIKTSDGKVLLDSQVQSLVQAMASFSPPAAGQTTLPANYQSSLGAVIAANWH